MNSVLKDILEFSMIHIYIYAEVDIGACLTLYLTFSILWLQLGLLYSIKVILCNLRVFVIFKLFLINEHISYVGIHRMLNAPISKVRSLRMDFKVWTPSLIQVCRNNDPKPINPSFHISFIHQSVVCLWSTPPSIHPSIQSSFHQFPLPLSLCLLHQL